MARPNKLRLDYFPLDVDIFEDEKVAAVSGEFGYKGEIILIKLLCAIYRNGYYYEWNDLQKMILLSRLPGISESLLENVVKRLVRWEFFDKALFDSSKIITSKHIQEVYFSATSRRRQVAKNLPYLLLPIDKNEINVCNNEVNNTFMQAKTTQSKRKEIITPLNPPEGGVGYSIGRNVLFSNKDGIERNYEGLIERLKMINVTDKRQIEEIIRLSNGGMIGHAVWGILAEFHKSSASAIKYPGLFIISKLKEYEKENFNLGNENN